MSNSVTESAKMEADKFILRCGSCNGKLSARRASIGKTFICPKCGASVTVIAPEERGKRESEKTRTEQPSCNADVRKANTPEVDEALVNFIDINHMCATSPTFYNSDDEYDRTGSFGELFDRHYDMCSDPTAYPRDILELLSHFSVEFLQLIRTPGGPSSTFPEWDDAAVARGFTSVYEAMARFDSRFLPPFPLQDRESSFRPENQHEVPNYLRGLLEYFDPVSRAFINVFSDSKRFSLVPVANALCACNLTPQPRRHKPGVNASHGDEALIKFIRELRCSALDPLFYNTAGEPLGNLERFNRFRLWETNPAAYPQEVVEILSEAFSECLQHLLLPQEITFHYPYWSNGGAANHFGDLYKAIAMVDSRFSPPFQIHDDVWCTAAENLPEIPNYLKSLLEYWEPVTRAFIVGTADRFSHDAMINAFESLGLLPLAKKEPQSSELPADRPNNVAPERLCSNCHGLLNSDDRFCGECGHAVSAVCSRCGEELGSTDRFCGECGEPI